MKVVLVKGKWCTTRAKKQAPCKRNEVIKIVIIQFRQEELAFQWLLCSFFLPIHIKYQFCRNLENCQGCFVILEVTRVLHFCPGWVIHEDERSEKWLVNNGTNDVMIWLMIDWWMIKWLIHLQCRWSKQPWNIFRSQFYHHWERSLHILTNADTHIQHNWLTCPAT